MTKLPDPGRFDYAPPTVKDWLRFGYTFGGELVTWPGKPKHHRCGGRLEVTDAVFGIGQAAEIRFVVACYCCQRVWDTGIVNRGEIDKVAANNIADKIAIRAATALNQGIDDDQGIRTQCTGPAAGGGG